MKANRLHLFFKLLQLLSNGQNSYFQLLKAQKFFAFGSDANFLTFNQCEVD